MSVNLGPKGGGSESTKRDAGQYEMPRNLTMRQAKQNPNSVWHRRQNLIEKCQYCGKGHPQGHMAKCAQRQCPAYGTMWSRCSKTSHFKAVCRLIQRQWQGHRLLKSSMSMHKVQQDEESHSLELEQNDRSFDLVISNISTLIML